MGSLIRSRFGSLLGINLSSITADVSSSPASNSNITLHANVNHHYSTDGEEEPRVQITSQHLGADFQIFEFLHVHLRVGQFSFSLKIGFGHQLRHQKRFNPIRYCSHSFLWSSVPRNFYRQTKYLVFCFAYWYFLKYQMVQVVDYK